MPSPNDLFVDQYRQAAGEGAVLELRMRLLANKHAPLRAVLDDRLEEVENEIIAVFRDHLQANEPEQLQLCRQLRNKILHCDFVTARRRLHALGAPVRDGGVRVIELDPAQEISSQLSAATQHPGASRPVTSMTSKSEIDVYGWLLELGAAGDFERAAAAFQSASAIVSRLADLSDEHFARL